MRQSEQGMATLFTSIMILLLATGILGYLNRGLFIEQKSISNQTWNIQARHAAEAGIEFFIVDIQRNSSQYLDANNVILPARNAAIDSRGNLVFSEAKVIGSLNSFGRASAYFFQVYQIDNRTLRIASTGFADCPALTGTFTNWSSLCSAKTVLTQDLNLAAVGLANSLTVKGRVDVWGAVDVSMLADAPLTGVTLNSGSTATGAPSQFRNGKNGWADDSKKSDSTLASTSSGDLFYSVFGQQPSQYLDTSKFTRYQTSGGQTTAAYDNSTYRRLSVAEFNAECQNKNSELRRPYKPKSYTPTYVAGPDASFSKTPRGAVYWIDPSLDAGSGGQINLTAGQNCVAGYSQTLTTDNGTGAMAGPPNVAAMSGSDFIPLAAGDPAIGNAALAASYSYNRGVTLVFDGNLTLPSKSRLLTYGASYVRGNLNFTGAMQFNGAGIVDGDLIGTGSFATKTELRHLQGLSVLANFSVSRQAGRWRDYVQ